MPNVIIGIDKWMKDNRGTVEAMLRAFFMGGDALKANPNALTHASKIADKVFNEPDTGPEYWEKYYKGVRETDKTGLQVELGGSSVNNLADNLYLFGMVPGSSNLFATTYRVFADIVKDQYPEYLPTYPPVEEILDTTYIKNISARSAPTATEIKKAQEPAPETTKQGPIKNVVSRKSWRIQFATGSDQFSASAKAQLDQILNDTLIASGTAVEIQGHTDNVGSPEKNMALSEARAFAVKKWLEARAPANFPKGRIRVRAFGQTAPIAPNTSDAGKATNRRVEIVMGKTE
ncbi:MAG: OmpA family protein [Microbacteriaceae bacterium]|nr:OmpA family protein [Microbacteriaceae bacterium]